VASLVKIRKPPVSEPANRETFVCRLDRAAWKQAKERDGSYLLRASIPCDSRLGEHRTATARHSSTRARRFHWLLLRPDPALPHAAVRRWKLVLLLHRPNPGDPGFMPLSCLLKR